MLLHLAEVIIHRNYFLLTYSIGASTTLVKLKQEVKDRIQQHISSTTIQCTTNSNSSKLDILQQLFKAFVINNKDSNGRQKGIL